MLNKKEVLQIIKIQEQKEKEAKRKSTYPFTW